MGVYIAVVRKIRTTAADHQSHNIEKIAQSGDTVATIDIPCLCGISTCRKSQQVRTKLNLCKIAEKTANPLTIPSNPYIIKLKLIISIL